MKPQPKLLNVPRSGFTRDLSAHFEAMKKAIKIKTGQIERDRQKTKPEGQ